MHQSQQNLKFFSLKILCTSSSVHSTCPLAHMQQEQLSFSVLFLTKIRDCVGEPGRMRQEELQKMVGSWKVESWKVGR